VIAGSGAAPHLSEETVRGYRPALGPTFVLSMLAILLAQPAQLPLWQEQLAPAVATHRAQLLSQQEALARELARPVPDSFRNELAQSEFLAFRVRAIWLDPQRAFALSALYWFLVLLPTLAGRFIALDALREYERARWLSARVQIQREGEESFARVDALLRHYPSYQRPASSQLSNPFGGSLPFLSRPRAESSASTSRAPLAAGRNKP
jgi:hypothetical protein